MLNVTDIVVMFDGVYYHVVIGNNKTDFALIIGENLPNKQMADDVVTRLNWMIEQYTDYTEFAGMPSVSYETI